MLPIQRMISPYNFTKGNQVKYIVLHYTANKGDNARNNAIYFNGGDRGASAHYFVSDNQIYQVVEDYNASWAVGDGKGVYGIKNSNSINVEMCCWIDGTVSIQTEANTVELVKYLMKKHNIEIAYVVRHYDASRKSCPNWTQERWNSFKNKLIDKPVEVKEEFKMDNLVCYGNVVDKRAAEYLADYLQCPCMDANLPFAYKGVAKNIIAVGGRPTAFADFSGYTTLRLQGSDRYETLKLVMKHMGKL